jgi:glyoxylase-like metal-dependent hydrolase (beta-lactamase superfamily II)
MNVFVVEHPAGLCVFDTGERADAAKRGYFPWWHPYFRLSRFELEEPDEAAEQLRTLGFEPNDVRWVVLSHLHTDHVGGVKDFSRSEIVVNHAEWARASGLGGRVRGYLPQRWPRGVVPSLVQLDGPPVGPFSGTRDLAGDGSMLIVPLPGHTPSHVGLLVPGHLLVGDLVESADELTGDLADWCEREGIRVLASHDDGATA